MRSLPRPLTTTSRVDAALAWRYHGAMTRETRYRVPVYVPEELVPELDRLRGHLSRSAYFTVLLARAIEAEKVSNGPTGVAQKVE